MPYERKIATVLFADIVGSTKLAAVHDAERVRDVVWGTFDRLRAVIELHGGTIEKFIGDEIMAVFGVPIAHDDDARRAVRCALAIRTEITSFELAARFELALRIGVNTGDVLAMIDTGTDALVSGQAVNIAARLRAAAAPGEILVGERTKRLTDHGVRYGSSRLVDAKNIGPVEAWPAELVATAAADADRGLRGLRAPLIGREHELRLLADAYRRLGGEQRPYLVTIFGPPGSGKSRLAEEFSATLHGATIRLGRCLPYGDGITFYPIQLMLREDLGLEASASREAAIEKLGRTIRDAFGDDEDADAVKRRIEVIAGLAEAREALPDVAEGQIGDELRWGVRRYFERRAASGPLVLLFEDIQWAEQRLLELIEDLAEWARAPILILCLARLDLRESRPTWGGGATSAAAITLSPLTSEQCRTLIAQLLTGNELPEQLRDEIIARAEGNPLYVEEFLWMLMDSGRIAMREGRWVVVAGLASAEVPATLQGIITARLDRAPPDVKRLLQSASIPGRVFPTTALAALAGKSPSHEVLREAIRRDFLVETDERATVGTGRVYRFKHVLIRDVAYSTVPKAERSVLHDRYSHFLEASLGERRAELADVLAFHAEQASLLAREVDAAAAPALGRRALDLLFEAAERAWQRDDTHAAANLYERCIGIAGTITVSSQELLQVTGPAALLQLTHEGETALPRIDELIDEGRRFGPSKALALLLMFRGKDLVERDLPAGYALNAEALSVARELSSPEIIAQVLRSSAMAALYVGALDEAQNLLTDADEHERANGIVRGRSVSLRGSATVNIRRARFSAAAANLAEAAPLVEAGRSRFERRAHQWAVSWLATAQADHAAAIAAASDSVRVAEELGIATLTAHSLWFLGIALLNAADDEGALSALLRSVEIFGPTNRGQRPSALADLGRAELRVGRMLRARSHVDEAERSLLPWDVEALVIVGLASALVQEASGDAVGAEARFRGTIDHAAKTQFDLWTGQARIDFARFLLSKHRRAEAGEQLGAARAIFCDPLAARRRAEIDDLLSH